MIIKLKGQEPAVTAVQGSQQKESFQHIPQQTRARACPLHTHSACTMFSFTQRNLNLMASADDSMLADGSRFAPPSWESDPLMGHTDAEDEAGKPALLLPHVTAMQTAGRTRFTASFVIEFHSSNFATTCDPPAMQTAPGSGR